MASFAHFERKKAKWPESCWKMVMRTYKPRQQTAQRSVSAYETSRLSQAKYQNAQSVGIVVRICHQLRHADACAYGAMIFPNRRVLGSVIAARSSMGLDPGPHLPCR